MKTVLFVWELGDGLGHVAPLAAIARALRQKFKAGECRIVFAVREPIFSRAAIGNGEWPVLPAPQYTGDLEAASYAASYTQLLAAIGFARRSDLTNILAAWDDLFGLIEPDLLVADHSPSAVIAARGRIPTLAVGSGFTLPPWQFAEFPALRTGMQAPAIQTLILENINYRLTSRGAPVLEHLPQLFQTDARAVFALPHLDPYGPFRRDRLLGPYDGGLRPDVGQTPRPMDAGLFYYGHAALPETDIVVEGLINSGVPVSAFITGPDTAAKAMLRERAHRFHETMPQLSEAFKSCSFVISHGGAGLTQSALMAGLPQVLLPIHVESQINSLRVAALGSGLVVENITGQSVKDAAETVSQVRVFQERAMEVAAGIGQLGLPADPCSAVAEMAVELLD